MKPIGVIAFLATTALAACGDDGNTPVQCTENGHCNLEPNGRCEINPGTGNQWCTYPCAVPGCESNRCWSDFDTGDGLSGTCVVYDIDAGIPPDAMIDASNPDAQMIDAMPPSGPLALRFGGSSFDVGSAIGLDAAGNIFIGGGFRLSGYFGDAFLNSNGVSDVFMASYRESNGSHRWSQSYGGSDSDSVDDLAIDSNGDIIIVGNYAGTVNFGGSSDLAGSGNNLFVAKYDGTTGAHIWSLGFDLALDGSVAIDSNNDVIVTGLYTGETSLGGPTLPYVGSFDAFVAKFNGASGAHIWSRGWGGTSADSPRGVAVDGNDNVIVVGNFQGTTNLGGGSMTSDGGQDGFVAKYLGTNGNHDWSFRFGSTSSDGAVAVGTNKTNSDVYVAGFISGTVNLGGSDLSSAGVQDIFWARFNSSGAHQYSTRYGTTGSDFAWALAVRNNGNVVIGGEFSGPMNVGGPNLAYVAGKDAWIAEYQPGGTHEWSFSYGSTGTDGINAIATRPGSVVATGRFEETVDFTTNILVSAGESDVFLIRLEQ